MKTPVLNALTRTSLCLCLALSMPLKADERTADVAVTPENPTTLMLSNSDVNRISCEHGSISDVRTSSEKGVFVDISGSNAFIKFQIIETGEELSYVTRQTEFFVVCNGAIYTILASPRLVAARTVRLVAGSDQRTAENRAMLGSLPLEERAVKISESVLNDSIPHGFRPASPDSSNRLVGKAGAIIVTPRRQFLVEGLALSVTEFTITATRSVALDERDFLSTDLGDNIYSVTLDKHTLSAGEKARLVIVYRGERS